LVYSARCPLAARSQADLSVLSPSLARVGSMSKISTVNPGRNPTLSAWARGPPSSTPSGPSNQPPSLTAASSTPAPVPPAVPRPTNGQTSHSRRSSAAFPNPSQPPPTTLKEPVAVSKSAGAYISLSLLEKYSLLSYWLGFFWSLTHGCT
jgi:hypothetical protein